MNSSKNVAGSALNEIDRNKNTSRASYSSCKSCLNGEYASAEQIYSTQNNFQYRTRSMYGITEQPIYANVGDIYNSHSSTSQTLNRNYNSDGSITPTNQGNHSEDTNESEQTFHTNNVPTVLNQVSTEVAIKTRPKWGGKPIPPKPPIRHSSSLSYDNNSSLHKSPSSSSGSSSAKLTRIYVVQDTNNSMDFPPPPPEAYINYTSPNGSKFNESNTAQINKNSLEQSCCDLLLPKNHLVLCNDVNCLKGIQSYDSYHNYENPISQAFNEQNYESYCSSRATLSNARKSYAFESPIELPHDR